MSASVKEESISWVARRVVYLVGLVVGLVLVYSGRATQEQVDGWIPAVVEVGGYVVSLGFGLATWRTGPDSDNSVPVVVGGAAKVDMLMRNVEGLVDALQRLPVSPVPVPAPAPRPEPTPVPVPAHPPAPEPTPVPVPAHPPAPEPEPVPVPAPEQTQVTLDALRALIEQNRRR